MGLSKNQTRKLFLQFFETYEIKRKAKVLSYNKYDYNGCPGFGISLNSGHYIKVYFDTEHFFLNIYGNGMVKIPYEKFKLKKELLLLLNTVSTDKENSVDILEFYIKYIMYCRQEKVEGSFVLISHLIADIPKLQNKSVQEKKQKTFKDLLIKNFQNIL